MPTYFNADINNFPFRLEREVFAAKYEDEIFAVGRRFREVTKISEKLHSIYIIHIGVYIV